MQRDNLQDRAIICRYNPTEPGDYLISVKWSGKHIYGSPFYIRIAESQEELEEFKQQISTYRVIEQ
jgi:filamin